MPEMEIDPAVLRQLAEQHRQVARETRDWAEPPHDWLKSFIDTYGKIAQPVKDALDDYYGARYRAGRALADEHDTTADNLIAAAKSYEEADDQIAQDLRRAGDGIGASHGTPTVSSPHGPGTSPVDGRTPVTASPVANTPVDVGPAGTAPAATTGSQVPGAGADQPGAERDTPAAATPGIAAQAPGTGIPTAGTGVDSTAAGAGAGTGTGAGTGAGTVAGGTPIATTPAGYAAGDDRAAAQAPSGATAQSDTPVPMPVTPFARAVAAAKDKEAEPAYVVGDAVDNDLLVARTLLAAVLAATDSVVGTHWAVGVLRGPAGAGVFITSNEGRGWLPAGLYLPREVSTPWLWDEMLDNGSGTTASPWEGITDPARVLVEFGLAWGPKANASVVALASSAPIDGSLQTRFPDVAMAGLVGPAYDVDLRVQTPDTVDRLELAGSQQAAAAIGSVPDSQIYARCAELAGDAHAKLLHSGPSSADTAESRRIRERILAVVESRQEVAPQWWEELREADDLLAASMLSRRVDVGRVEPGDLRIDEEGAALRDMVFERRCNELLLLLAGDPTRQQLRDAAYAHDQVVNHPEFTMVPAAMAAATESADRVVTVPGQVVAPGATAGPPRGAAVATPDTPPPVIAPSTGPS